MWENINCGDFINCGRLSSLFWVVLNAISSPRCQITTWFRLGEMTRNTYNVLCLPKNLTVQITSVPSAYFWATKAKDRRQEILKKDKKDKKDKRTERPPYLLNEVNRLILIQVSLLWQGGGSSAQIREMWYKNERISISKAQWSTTTIKQLAKSYSYSYI